MNLYIPSEFTRHSLTLHKLLHKSPWGNNKLVEITQLAIGSQRFRIPSQLAASIPTFISFKIRRLCTLIYINMAEFNYLMYHLPISEMKSLPFTD